MNTATKAETMSLVESEAQARPLQNQPRPTAPSVQDILAVAYNQGAPVETLERLWHLSVQVEEREARKQAVTAFAAFKAEPILIVKNKQVGYKTQDGDFVGYSHADLAEVLDAVTPAMAKHGLSHRWDVERKDGRIFVTCIITHASGHSERVTLDAAPDASGKKNAIQQVASTITYLQRYTLHLATGTAAQGMDDDGRGGADNDQADGSRERRPEPRVSDVSHRDVETDSKAYPAADFERNRAIWRQAVEEGKRTPAQLISIISTKGALSLAQQKEIQSWAA